MKTLFTIALLFVSISGFCQDTSITTFPINPATDKVRITNVIEAEASKDEIHSRALNWATDTFKSAKDVLQVDNREVGLISGRANYPIQEPKALQEKYALLEKLVAEKERTIEILMKE